MLIAHFFGGLRVVPRPSSQAAQRLQRQVRCHAIHKKQSYYEVLGVPPGATQPELRAAYRSLAKELHPDVSQDDSEEEFVAINQAYAVLSDPDERARYDTLWRYEQERQSRAESGAPLSPEDMERAAALERLEAAHAEAARARRLAVAARRAAEAAKRAAVQRVREARVAAAAAAATAPAVGGGQRTAAGKVPWSAPEPQADADPRVNTDHRSARQAAQAAAKEAKRQAREARRHASQVRYWAQWAEREAAEVARVAGVEPAEDEAAPGVAWQRQQQGRRGQRQQRQWQPPDAPPE